jgi:hypothetical protein
LSIAVLQAHHVEGLASMLGLQKVGWLFAHPSREAGFHFSGPEIMFAAEQQLEAAGGISDTPFVTIKMTVDEKVSVLLRSAFSQPSAAFLCSYTF